MISSSLGIHGWGQITDRIIEASILSGDPLLMVSGPGHAKTSLAVRFGQVLLKKLKGTRKERLTVSIINAATAQPEDWSGYNLPPKDGGETMRMIKSPQTLLDSILIAIDEISRADVRNQNKLHTLIQEGEVDGRKTKAEMLWGMMNPPSGEYSDEGSEPLIGSIADRFGMMVEIPSFYEMSESDKRDVAMLAYKPHSDKSIFGRQSQEKFGKVDYIVPDQDVEDIWEFFQEAKRIYLEYCLEDKHRRHVAAVALYVSKVAQIIKDSQTARFYLSGRRAGMMVRSILADNAVAEVNGRADMAVSAEVVLLHSLMNKAMGVDYNAEPLMSAHDVSVKILAGADDVMTSIMAEPDKWKRLEMAFGRSGEIKPDDIVKVYKDLLAAQKDYETAEAAIGMAMFDHLAPKISKHELSALAKVIAVASCMPVSQVTVMLEEENDLEVYQEMQEAGRDLHGSRMVMITIYLSRKKGVSVTEVWPGVKGLYRKALNMMGGV